VANERKRLKEKVKKPKMLSKYQERDIERECVNGAWSCGQKN
jgi:hypothetical protein